MDLHVPTLAILCLILVLSACGPKEPPDGSSSTGTPDPHPAVTCDGGTALGGEPCVTDCDCAAPGCATFTDTDGGVKKVCFLSPPNL